MKTVDEFVPISFSEASQRASWARREKDINNAALWEYIAVLTMRLQSLEEKVEKLDR